MTNERTIWLALLCAAALAGIAAFAVTYAQGSKRPDRAQMHRHVLTRLSDEDIRAAHAKAVISAAAINSKHEEQKAAQALQNERKQDELRRACSDVAYKERNAAACASASGTTGYEGMLGMPPSAFYYHGDFVTHVTVDDELEVHLLGACIDVKTIREAREMNCLPPSD